MTKYTINNNVNDELVVNFSLEYIDTSIFLCAKNNKGQTCSLATIDSNGALHFMEHNNPLIEGLPSRRSMDTGKYKWKSLYSI